MADIRRDVATAMLINPLPAPVRMPLLLDNAFRSSLSLAPQFWFPLKNGVGVETVSLHNALRAAVAGRKTAKITLKGGRRVRARLGQLGGGRATIIIDNEGFAFTHADLLSAKPAERLQALQGVFARQPLLVEEEINWRKIAETRALTDDEYVNLITALGHTPEAFAAELEKPQGLNADSMMPHSPDYYVRLTARLDTSTTFEGFVATELAAARNSLMQRSSARAIRRIAFSGEARITDFLAVIVESCAVHREIQAYRATLGQNVARVCFFATDAEALGNIEAILTVLKQRDEKLTPCLAKAMAIIKVKRGRG